MHDILVFLSSTMTTPTPFGWFHIMWLVITVAATVLLCVFFRKCTDKQYRWIMLTIGIICILMEVYKQVVVSYNIGTQTWSYKWHIFPFLMSSTPIYACLIIGFVKNISFRNWLTAYLATFIMFGGFGVMVQPGQVFTATIGVNIQTMFLHGAMFVVGVFTIVSGKCGVDWRSSWKTILKGMAVFAVCVAIALALNLITWAAEIGQYFNMFEISPYYPNRWPILAGIWENQHYVVFLLAYYAIMSFFAALFYYMVLGIKTGVAKLAQKRS